MPRGLGSDLAILAAASLALALYLEGPALTCRAVYDHDHRQAPHWATYHTPAEGRANFVLEYAAWNESPLQNGLYWLGTIWVDSLTLSKILGVSSYVALTCLFYAAGRRLYGRRAGILMALGYAFLPPHYPSSSGFFSKFWAIPLVLAAYTVLGLERWRWLVVLMPFAALAYPMMAVVLGLIALVEAGRLAVAQRAVPWRALAWLSAASAAAIAVLGVKYFSPPEWLGEMHSSADMRDILTQRSWEFHGLAAELGRFLGQPVFVYGAVVAGLTLGLRRLVWEPRFTTLLFSAGIGYIAADITFPRLYIPDRYSTSILIVLTILWLARNAEGILDLAPAGYRRRLLALGLLGAATLACRDRFVVGEYQRDAREFEAVSAFIRTLPADTLLAGPGADLDDIVLLSGKPAMHNYLMDHRWYIGHKREVHRRSIDVFSAVYAATIEPLDLLATRYGATHLVVHRRYFGDNLRSRKFQSRYDSEVQRIVGRRSTFYVSELPRAQLVYDSSDFLIVALTKH